MGRTVVAEESVVAAYVDGLLQSGAQFQTGLLVGLPCEGRDLILTVIPTPSEDEDAGPASLTQVSSSWIDAHASQVASMLPGGVKVLGLFFLSPSEDYKAQGHIIKGLAQATQGGQDGSHALVLQKCSDNSRVVCRSYECASTGLEDAKPADFKFQKIKSKLHTFTCKFNVDFHVQLPSTPPSESPMDYIQDRCQRILEQLSESQCLVDGAFESAPNVHGLTENQHTVELLLRGGQLLEDCASPIISGSSVQIKGTIHSTSYAFFKDTVAYAVQAVKEDIAKSILHRVNLLCEEAMDIAPDSLLGGSWNAGKASAVWALPRRVYFPAPASAIVFCDYICSDETLAECGDRCQEILGATVSSEDFIAPENSEIPRVPIGSGSKSHASQGSALAPAHSDGTSDTPALKKANIGTGIGDSETSPASSSLVPLAAAAVIAIVAVAWSVL